MAEWSRLNPEREFFVSHFPSRFDWPQRLPPGRFVLPALPEDHVGVFPVFRQKSLLPDGLGFRPDEPEGAESFEFGAAAAVEEFVLCPVRGGENGQRCRFFHRSPTILILESPLCSRDFK